MIKMLTADAKHTTRGKNHQIKYSSPENAMMELAWVSAIIHDHIYDVTLSKWSEMIGLKSEMGYSVVYTLTGRGKELSHEDKLPLYRNFKHTCKKKVHCIVGPMSGMHIPVFVLLDSSERWNAHSARAHALRFARQMIGSFTLQFKHVQLLAGIGTWCSSFSGLANSYQEAVIASRKISSLSMLHFYGDLDVQEDHPHPYPIVVESKLLSEIRQGHVERALDLFSQYVQEITLFAQYDLSCILYDLQKLFVIIEQTLKEIGIQIPEWNVSECGGDLNQLHNNVKFQLKRMLDQLHEWQLKDMSIVIQQAKQYIEAHYAMDLSLDNTAEQMRLKPHYFSRLFKERCGTTFIDYLTHIRIERAKDLLLYPNSSLKTICRSVGYRDPNYFSRVFRKTVGVSPSEFRELHT